MTVAALPATVQYVEDGISRTFPVPYRFKSAADLVVERIAGASTVRLQLGVDYSVSGGGSDAGGTLTRTAATSGATLVIRRSTALAQTMAYATGDRFPARSHEEALDTQAMIAQELHDRATDTADRALLALPGQVMRPVDKAALIGRLLGGDAEGEVVPVTMRDSGGVDTLATLADPAAGARLVRYGNRSAASKLDDITRTIFDVASAAEQARLLIGGFDLSVFIERMKAIGGRWRIPDLGYQYEMTSRVTGLPRGMRLLFDDGVSVIYTGALPGAGGVGGLFETTADHVVIACYDPEGRVTFRSQIPGARLWLHCGKSASGMRTRRVVCIDMKVQIAYPADEAAVLAGDLSGAPHNAAAYDWECSYTGRDVNAAEGVVMHYFVQRGRCARGQATRAGSGYQAWGGNADFNKHGTPSDDATIEAARLKCRDILVSDVVCADMTNTFVFLCMVEGGRVDRCIGDKAWDVGFDAEGCRDVSFVDCQGKHASNGVFTVYFFADNVVIRNPTVTCDLATTYPTAIATINPSRRADYVPGVAIIGGRIESREGSGKPISIVVEAMAHFRLEGVEMVHAHLVASALGLHSVSVMGNRFRLTRRMPFAVDLIAVGPELNNLGFDGPKAHISGNSFAGIVAQPVGTRLAYLASSEANVSPSYLYADNDADIRTGPDRDTATGYAGLHIDWAGANPGVGFYARLLGNGGRGHPMTCKRQSAAASNPNIVIGTKITVPDGAGGTTDRVVNTNLLLDGTPVVPAAI